MKKSTSLIIPFLAVMSLNAYEIVEDFKKDIWEAVSKHQIIVLADSCASEIDTIVEGIDYQATLHSINKIHHLDTFINVTFCIKKSIAGDYKNPSFTFLVTNSKFSYWGTYWMFDPIDFKYKSSVNDSVFKNENNMSVEHAISLLELYIKGTLTQSLTKSDENLINYIKKLPTVK
jgi:hypothetical protein